ncbi:MAG: TIGR00730 family Rossman fold protein [Gammaproteobacteria bacterium]|nr:TIGR00730 family Rossman fold protein [Gammaproteobacteria bacterium]
MNICVFAGSSPGKREAYKLAARQLGEELASRNIGLVYGGASVGLMGAVADGALAKGGAAIGVIPSSLADVEIAHTELDELLIVPTMHERKAQMAESADAFIALPGGIGTLEESFEVWTWSQLGIHKKPLGLLNVEGYFDGLNTFLDHIVAEGFVKEEHRGIMVSAAEPGSLIDQLLEVDVPQTRKWAEV